MQGRNAARAETQVLAGLAAAFALMLAGPATAQPAAPFVSHVEGGATLVLAAGERVVLKLSPDGRLEIVSITPATLADVVPPKPLGRPLGPKEGNPLVEVPEGNIAFVMGYTPDDTLMKVENGASLAFDYEGWIPTSAGGLEPTSVCTLLPLLAGYEHWPKRRIERLLLNHFVSRQTNQVICPQPSGPPPAIPAL